MGRAAAAEAGEELAALTRKVKRKKKRVDGAEAVPDIGNPPAVKKKNKKRAEPLQAEPENTENDDPLVVKKKAKRRAEELDAEPEDPGAEDPPAVKRKTKRGAEQVDAEPDDPGTDDPPVVQKKAKRRAEEPGTTAEAGEDAAAFVANKNKDTPADKSLNSINEEFRVFVSGIPRDLEEAIVRKDFEVCGPIANFKLLRDKETGDSRGLAFVSFKDEAGFNAALEYDGDDYGDYGGQRLRVKKAQAQGKGIGKGSGGMAPGSKPAGCNSVVLRRLAPEVTETDISETFKHCGSGPTKVGLLLDKATGRSRCTARIDFDPADSNGVDQAMELLGSELRGRNLTIDYCKPREW